MTDDVEHDDDWYRRRFEADKRRMIEEWGPCAAADELEAAMLAAPRPNPDGTPVVSSPIPVSQFVRLEDRLLPTAKVECLPDGTLGPVRYRADLADGDEVAYDDQIDQ